MRIEFIRSQFCQKVVWEKKWDIKGNRDGWEEELVIVNNLLNLVIYLEYVQTIICSLEYLELEYLEVRFWLLIICEIPKFNYKKEISNWLNSKESASKYENRVNEKRLR